MPINRRIVAIVVGAVVVLAGTSGNVISRHVNCKDRG
jgi:hypothetical protein